MMRKIYILDFDGTLGDSRGLILRTMMDTFDALGIDRPTEELASIRSGCRWPTASWWPQD